jgi:hypothetical protein
MAFLTDIIRNPRDWLIALVVVIIAIATMPAIFYFFESFIVRVAVFDLVAAVLIVVGAIVACKLERVKDGGP